MPRLDYSGGASCPSLLLEPQRSNVITQSEYLAGWNRFQNVTKSIDGSIVNPEGALASKYTKNSTSTSIASFDFVNISASTEYTFSYFAKKGNYSRTKIEVGAGANNVQLEYNFDTDTLSGVSNGSQTLVDSSVQDYGNGWVRIIGVFTGTQTSINLTIYLLNAVNDYIYLYGVQVEQGSYPTSYIPTYGSSVTRSGDSCTDAGDASLFNINQGVVFGEFSALADDGTFRQFGLAGTNGNEVNLSLDSVSNRIGGIVRSNFTYYTLDYVVTDTKQNNKAALKYEGSVIKLFVNGSLVDSFTTATAPLDLSEFNFGIGTGNFNKFYGKMNQVLIFPTALTDSECIALTTI
jgi:hypothetical protein